jgi:hypothetical protein
MEAKLASRPHGSQVGLNGSQVGLHRGQVGLHESHMEAKLASRMQHGGHMEARLASMEATWRPSWPPWDHMEANLA